MPQCATMCHDFDILLTHPAAGRLSALCPLPSAFCLLPSALRLRRSPLAIPLSVLSTRRFVSLSHGLPYITAATLGRTPGCQFVAPAGSRDNRPFVSRVVSRSGPPSRLARPAPPERATPRNRRAQSHNIEAYEYVNHYPNLTSVNITRIARARQPRPTPVPSSRGRMDPLNVRLIPCLTNCLTPATARAPRLHVLISPQVRAMLRRSAGEIVCRKPKNRGDPAAPVWPPATLPAAERRKNVARGASRGTNTRESPKPRQGRKHAGQPDVPHCGANERQPRRRSRAQR